MQRGRAWRWTLVRLLLALLAGPLTVQVVRAASPYSCDEAGLDAALAAGGMATFACPGPTTILTTSAKTIQRNVILDGGGLLTVRNGPTVQDSVFHVDNYDWGIPLDRHLNVTFRGLTISGGAGHDDNGTRGGGVYLDGAPRWWSIASSAGTALRVALASTRPTAP